MPCFLRFAAALAWSHWYSLTALVCTFVHRRQAPAVPPEKSANDEVERRGIEVTGNEAGLSQSPTLSLVHRRCGPAIARTDC